MSNFFFFVLDVGVKIYYCIFNGIRVVKDIKMLIRDLVISSNPVLRYYTFSKCYIKRFPLHYE